MLPVARPFEAKSPMTAMKTWLLPEPDSPTMPRVSPASTARLTLFAASTTPSGVAKRISRSRMSRTGWTMASAVLGIEGIAQAVADEVEAAQGHRQHDRGEYEGPGRGLHEPRAVAD